MDSFASDLSALKRAVKRGLLDTSFLTRKQTVYVDTLGKAHGHPNCPMAHPKARYRLSASPETTTKHAAVNQLLLEVRCYCVDLFKTDLTGTQARLIAEIDNLAVLAKKATPGKLSSGARTKRISTLEAHERHLERLDTNQTVIESLKDAHYAASNNVKEAIRHLKGLTADSGTCELKVTEARCALTSKRANVTLDETPVLVTLVSRSTTYALEEFLAAFILKDDGRHYAVALMPRFAYDYFQRELYRTNSGIMSLNSVAAHPDEEINRFAATLWTPEDLSAPYSDISEALKAASAMEG